MYSSFNLSQKILGFRWPTRLSSSIRPGESETRWIDGLRGLSACFVICNHLTLSLAPEILFPASEEARIQSIWQWPFIQAFSTGFPWVAFFLVLSAWVNSIKPLKSLQQGQYEEAALSLSSSCFRRVLRLVAPITVATIMSWFLAQLGAFQLGVDNSNDWLRSTSPRPSPTVGNALWALWYSFYATWSEATNYYDRNLWCMSWFIRSSMLLYLFLLATCRMRPSIRATLLGAMLFWAWRSNDDLVGIPTYMGILLATLAANPQFREFSSTRGICKSFLSSALFLTGLFFLSFPSYHWEFAPWFNFFTNDLYKIFPGGANLFNQSIYIGIAMILISILLSSKLQSFLQIPPLLWLGELSLPIYLIHGPLLRSLFLWIAYAFIKYPEYYEEIDDDGYVLTKVVPLTRPSGNRLAIALPVYLLATLYLANIWNRTIELWCSAFARSVEEICIGKKEILVSFRVTSGKPELET